jgi:hypothetical protein
MLPDWSWSSRLNSSQISACVCSSMTIVHRSRSPTTVAASTAAWCCRASRRLLCALEKTGCTSGPPSGTTSPPATAAAAAAAAVAAPPPPPAAAPPPPPPMPAVAEVISSSDAPLLRFLKIGALNMVGPRTKGIVRSCRPGKFCTRHAHKIFNTLRAGLFLLLLQYFLPRGGPSLVHVYVHM